MSSIFYKTEIVTGDIDNRLDGIPNYNLTDTDITIVVYFGFTFFYGFDTTSVLVENFPFVIQPNTGNPIGRWILCM